MEALRKADRIQYQAPGEWRARAPHFTPKQARRRNGGPATPFTLTLCTSGRLRSLEIHDNVAQLHADTDPGSVEPVLAAADRRARVEFGEPLPSDVLDAAARALAVHDDLRLRVYGHEVFDSLDFLSHFKHVRHFAIDVWEATG